MNRREEIVNSVRKGPNKAGKPWNLTFEVAPVPVKDGGWLQVFIHSNAKPKNAAAERQIISDVESDLSEKFSQELLLVPVDELSTVFEPS